MKLALSLIYMLAAAIAALLLQHDDRDELAEKALALYDDTYDGPGA